MSYLTKDKMKLDVSIHNCSKDSEVQDDLNKSAIVLVLDNCHNYTNYSKLINFYNSNKLAVYTLRLRNHTPHFHKKDISSLNSIDLIDFIKQVNRKYNYSSIVAFATSLTGNYAIFDSSDELDNNVDGIITTHKVGSYAAVENNCIKRTSKLFNLCCLDFIGAPFSHSYHRQEYNYKGKFNDEVPHHKVTANSLSDKNLGDDYALLFQSVHNWIIKILESSKQKTRANLTHLRETELVLQYDLDDNGSLPLVRSQSPSLCLSPQSKLSPDLIDWEFVEDPDISNFQSDKIHLSTRT